jgi:hypothetical protein
MARGQQVNTGVGSWPVMACGVVARGHIRPHRVGAVTVPSSKPLFVPNSLK